MIICHKYKFIFLKTEKTAGTSIEIALSKFCDANDVITPVSPEDEKIRNALGYIGAQNCTASLREYAFKDWAKLMIKGKRKLRFYNHISAGKVRALIKRDTWDSYYKFCFERNPWDRVVSLYYYRAFGEPDVTIAEFVDSNAPLSLKRRGYNLYTINRKIAVDKVCRFEDLRNELEKIRVHLGIPEKLELPHAKSGFRKDRRNYREIYGDREKAKIAELFKEEIDLMGYKF